MPYDSIISRTDASALIPPAQVTEVIRVAAQDSLALAQVSETGEVSQV